MIMMTTLMMAMMTLTSSMVVAVEAVMVGSVCCYLAIVAVLPKADSLQQDR